MVTRYRKRLTIAKRGATFSRWKTGKRVYPSSKISSRSRFYKLARSLCPNSLTVKQHISVFNTRTASINVTGTAANQSMYITQGSLLPTYGAMAFRLDDIPQFATYSALFDQYKILKVLVRFRPQFNVADIKTDQNSIGTPQTLLTLIDFDDANAPTGLDEIRDYQLCREHNFFKEFTVELTPRIAISAYNGAFGAFANTTSYLDIASVNVQHYAVKFGISTATSTYGQAWTVSAEYIVDFKNIR